MPLAVLEDVQVVRIAVACELHERPMVANMLWGTSPSQVLGSPSARTQTSQLTPCDQCRDILDGGKSLVENYSSMFRIAIVVQVGCLEASIVLCVCDRCSCCHGYASLRVGVVGTNDLNHIVGEREHQTPAVVPIDLDLRPTMVRMNRSNGAERSVRESDRDPRACGSVGSDLRLWVLRSWLRFLSFRESCRGGFSSSRRSLRRPGGVR